MSRLKALRSINKLAKVYSQNADKMYERGNHLEAQKASLRKDALYEYKHHILLELYHNNEYETVQEHIIDGARYYQLSINGYRFHIPFNKLNRSWDAENATTISVDTTTSRAELSMTERDAIMCLATTYGSVNRFLEKRILRGDQQVIVYWPYV